MLRCLVNWNSTLRGAMTSATSKCILPRMHALVQTPPPVAAQSSAWQATFTGGQTGHFQEGGSSKIARLQNKTRTQTAVQTTHRNIQPCFLSLFFFFSFLSAPQQFLPASCATQSYLISHWGRVSALHSVCVCECVCICPRRNGGDEFTSQACTTEPGNFHIKTTTVCFW